MEVVNAVTGDNGAVSLFAASRRAVHATLEAKLQVVFKDPHVNPEIGGLFVV